MLQLKSLMDEAQISIGSHEEGQEFVVKDLFEGYYWQNMPKGDRMNFGRFFKNEVLEGRVSGILFAGKSGNNSKKYVRRNDKNG